jgi:hypothetical protein
MDYPASDNASSHKLKVIIRLKFYTPESYGLIPILQYSNTPILQQIPAATAGQMLLNPEH